MKTLYTIVLLLFSFGFLQAQLPDGTVAPPWTLQDFQTNESYTLQDYIDQGIPVMLDFSATWCTLCWNYHNGHVFRDMYNEYGPNGSVEQDRVMVFFMEAFYGSNDACLIGDNANCNSSTIGDWTAGEPYPFFNLQSDTDLVDLYDIDGYPTLYIVSPQGTLFEVGPASKSTWESWVFDSFTLSIDGSNVTQISCDGDVASIDINVSGGSGVLSYNWSNGATTEDITDLDPGTYSVTVTEGRGYEVSSQEFTIFENAGAITGDIVVEEIDCFGESNGVLTANVQGGTGTFSYLWSNGETTQEISGLTEGVYSVDVTDSNDCVLSLSYELVEPSALGESHVSEETTCGLDNGSIQISGTGGVGPYIYQLGSQSNNTGSFNNLSAGSYSLTIIDANDCILFVNVDVDEIEPPVSVATTDQVLNCVNTQVVLSGEGSSVGSEFEYLWMSNDGGVIVDGQGTLMATVEGGGSYSLIITENINNCMVVSSVFVEEDIIIPLSDAGNGQTITCDVLEATLDGTASEQGDDINYSWSTTDGNIISGENTITPIVNAAGTYTILVTNSVNGCSSNSSVQVNQTADLPVADAGDSQSITCNSSTAILDGSGSETGNGIEYNWTTEDGSIVSGENTLNPEVNAPGSYLLQVYNTDTGCNSFATVIVEDETNPPSAEIVEPELLTCILTEFNLSINVAADQVEYNWTTSDGNIINGANTDMPLISEPGTYIVNYTDLETGCIGNQSVVVSQNINTPTAQFEINAIGVDFSFNNQSEGENNTYEWDFGDGGTSTEENPDYTYTESGDYMVCLTVTNECGSEETCTEISVLVGASLLFTSEINTPLCHGDCDATLVITPEGNPDDLTTVITGPGLFMAENTYLLEDLCGGLYLIEITNQVGDSNIQSIEITEPEELMIQESEVVHVDCNGNENGMIEINVTGGTGALNVNWNNNETGTVIEGLSGGEYEVTIIDENGCEQIVEFTVNEPAEVDVNLVDIVNIDDSNQSGAIDIDVDGGTAPYFFLWSNGDQTEDIVDLDFGQYTVIVSDANGCSDEYGPYEVKNLVAVDDIEIINTFSISPNPTTGDVVIELELSEFIEAKLSVLNNLGQVLMQEELSFQTLEKTYEFEELPSGLYFYRVQIDNNVVLRKIVKQ